MIYIQLFISFLIIGAFSFGGGYAAMPLIQSQVVNIHHWLSLGELTDLVTISQMTPGPIAINAATFVGIKVDGFLGAVVATLGCIIPSCIIVITMTYFYMKYRHLQLLKDIFQMLRPAVISLIAVAGVSIILPVFFSDSMIILSHLHIHMVIIFMICMYLLMVKKLNPIYVMLLAGLFNLLWNMVII